MITGPAPVPASLPAVRCAPVFEVAGITDVVAKIYSSTVTNPFNVRATINAFHEAMNTPAEYRQAAWQERAGTSWGKQHG